MYSKKIHLYVCLCIYVLNISIHIYIYTHTYTGHTASEWWRWGSDFSTLAPGPTPQFSEPSNTRGKYFLGENKQVHPKADPLSTLSVKGKWIPSTESTYT